MTDMNESQIDGYRHHEGQSLKFVEVTERDLDLYESLVRPHLDRADFITPDEHRRYSDTLTSFGSWFLVDETDADACVGWCAAGDPSDSIPTAVHFYGGIILPAYRGRGYSHLLYSHRFAAFPGRDFTASVQPSSIIALNTTLAYGFKPFLYHEPWIELVRWHSISADLAVSPETAAAPVRR